MNYIGSKYSLLEFISSTVHNIAGEDLSDKVFCDIFAGTGIVGRAFKTKVKKSHFK
jgi:adenine-specific DNA-methyltransferase